MPDRVQTYLFEHPMDLFSQASFPDQPANARVIPFGDPISSKSDVEERIRQAQCAILNPSMGHKTFLKGMDVGSFSRNHVSLEINLQTSRL